VTNVNIEESGLTDTESNPAYESPVYPGTEDFAENPNLVVYTVPVPEDILERDRMIDDSLLLADTSSKIDQFVLPQVDKSLQVNKKF
jgi:hypothetical protein